MKKHRDLNRQIADLEAKIENASNQINDQYVLDELKDNSELLEKFAREELYLQKEDEDVFIIINE